jgi:hypothetical protein
VDHAGEISAYKGVSGICVVLASCLDFARFGQTLTFWQTSTHLSSCHGGSYNAVADFQEEQTLIVSTN